MTVDRVHEEARHVEVVDGHILEDAATALDILERRPMAQRVRVRVRVRVRALGREMNSTRGVGRGWVGRCFSLRVGRCISMGILGSSGRVSVTARGRGCRA